MMLACGGTLNSNMEIPLSKNEYEQTFLGRWSHAKKKDKEHRKGLCSCETFLLQVHGCHKNSIFIISINPNNKYNFVNVNLAN